MKICVTGSSGFLGSNSVHYFRDRGHDVVGVDILPATTTDIVQDLSCQSNLIKGEFDVLLHFAANIGGRQNIETNYLDIVKNIEIDRQMFSWAMRKVHHIVYPSSSAVYPVNLQTKVNSPLREDLIDFANNKIGVSDHLYGWAKLSAERMLWQIGQETDLQIHVLRPFSGYGPGQDLTYPMPNLVNMVLNTPCDLEVWGDGLQSRDWVHVQDILRVLDWCIGDYNKYLTLNIGTGIATTFFELINRIYQEVYGQNTNQCKTRPDKPVGVLHRVADVSLLQKLNILPQITLSQGIRTMI